MRLLLLLCAMLLQAAPQTDSKPAIDNDRVAVWKVTSSAGARPLDSVIVSLSGNASFVVKGTASKINEQSIVISLKEHPVPPIANTSGYPLGFPRPGAKKLLENDRVIVWDYSWQLGVPNAMHFHDKDVVVLFLEDGDLKSTTPDGQETVVTSVPGTVRFNTRNRTHYETLVRGKQHAIITELK